jgi:V/A-type H+-transporting ATPase subunit D
MAKLKLTKQELRNQREALARFTRFLPTLELKKDLLVREIQQVVERLSECDTRETRVRAGLEPWVQLFAEPVELENMVRLRDIRTGEENIAGVRVPVFTSADFDVADYDLHATPLWVDAGVAVVQELGALEAEREVLRRQRAMLLRELQVTIQRINLFEKVKIPESKENIRRIQIYLGDQQANAVVRGKISKSKLADAQMGSFV